MLQIGNIEFPEEMASILEAKSVTQVLRNVADSAQAHWIKLVSKSDSSFRQDYMNGIQPVKYLPNVSVLELVGEVPHILEDGSSPLDMRKTLLGPEVPVVPLGERGKHQSRNGGYYRAIPFRHTVPGSGKGTGQAMGSAYGSHAAVADAAKLGRAVYRAAKKLQAYGDPYKKGSKEAKKRRMDTSQIHGGLAKGMNIPLLKPHHKSDIYKGMIRQKKTYKKVTQNQYTTFRTISTNVREGWIRKQIIGEHYLEKVSTFVAKIAPMAVEAFFKENT